MQKTGIYTFLSMPEGKIVLFFDTVLALSGSFSIYVQSQLIENICMQIGKEKNNNSLIFSIVLLAVSFLIPSLEIFSDFLKIKINHLLDKVWDDHVTGLVSQIPYKNYEYTKTYNELKQIADLNLLTSEYSFFLLLISTVISIVSYMVILLKISITLTITFLVLGPLVGYYSSRLADKEYKKSYTLNSERRSTLYKSSVLRTREYAKEIRIFNAGEYMFSDWKKSQVSIDGKILKMRLKYGLLGALISKSEYLVIIINLMILLWAYTNKTVSFGMFAAISGQVFRFRILSKVQNIASSHKKLKEYKSAYFKIRTIVTDSGYTEKGFTNSAFGENTEYVIELKNVSFKYPNSDEVILRNINLKIRKDEKIAIVGKNGAGKTTLIKLILGLYLPDEGEVYIDGVSTKALSNSKRSSLFSVVFQDFAKFCLTVDENLSLKENSIIKHKEIFNIDAIENGLKDGGNTVIGKEYSKAVDLSGGEWQRIAITRAFQEQKKILIFDEPTASLDPIAEVQMYEKISALSAGISDVLLFITHRLGLTRNVDRIIVLDEGAIAEDGTFNELMDLRGCYYQLFQSQKALYNRRNFDEK